MKAAHLPTLEIRVEQKGNRVKKERKRGEKEEIINAAATGNRTRDLSITEQMSVLTNQVHLKIHFRHRFDQKCPFTDSLHSNQSDIRPVPFKFLDHKIDLYQAKSANDFMCNQWFDKWWTYSTLSKALKSKSKNDI